MVINPMAAFLNWFESLSLVLKKSLAHIYRVSTTDNTMDMVMEPEISFERFKNSFVKPDFPLRVAARVFTVRAVFDLILLNRETLVSIADEYFSLWDQEKMIPLSSHQWDRAYDSWKVLRSRELSDRFLHEWANQLVKQETMKK